MDLFCGAGGLSLGLERRGFTPVLAVDHDEAAIATYRHNRPWMSEAATTTSDVRDLLTTGLPHAPVLVGGPPCQGFSNANQQPLSEDPRNELYKAFIQAAVAVEASVVLLENVPGMLQRRRDVESDLEAAHFTVRPYIFDAASFGFPQNRKRIFWLGVRTGLRGTSGAFEVFERLTRPPSGRREFDLSDAIGDLPSVEAKTERNSTWLESERWGWTVAAHPAVVTEYVSELHGATGPGRWLFNHRSKYNNGRDIEIFRRLLPGEGSNAESIRDIMPYANRSHIFKDKFFRLRPDRPSKTITAHMYYDCNMYIHPSQARGLTPREAARIQGFPDHYYFLGYPNEWYRQIGNAVSPLVGATVGAGLHAVCESLGIGES